MGYYSDVAIAIRKRDAKRLFDEVAKRPDEDIVKWFVSNRMEEFNINDADPNPDGVQVLRWYGVKWYDEFEEVQYIMNFIRSLGYGNYEFMRIGEDVDDVEREGEIAYKKDKDCVYSDYVLYLEREICFDPSSLPLHGDY